MSSRTHTYSLTEFFKRLNGRVEFDVEAGVSPDKASIILMKVPDNEGEIRARTDCDGSRRRADAIKIRHYLH